MAACMEQQAKVGGGGGERHEDKGNPIDTNGESSAQTTGKGYIAQQEVQAGLVGCLKRHFFTQACPPARLARKLITTP